MRMKNHYATLGVSNSASAADLKSAYRKLAMQYHPDKNPGDAAAEARFKEIGEAYEILKDPQKRAAYDYESTASRRPYAQNEFSNRYNRAPQYADMGAQFEDLLKDLERRRRAEQMQRNKDVNLSYMITLEEAFTGKSATVSYRVEGGQQRQVNVQVPKSCVDGQRIRFAGQGDNSVAHAAPGDLYLTVRIAPHDRFVRYGNDLGTTVYIDYIDAMLGCSRNIVNIDGSEIRVNVPVGITPGQSLKVPGKGMASVYDANQRGNLLVEVVIEMPKLTEDQLEKLKKLRN